MTSYWVVNSLPPQDSERKTLLRRVDGVNWAWDPVSDWYEIHGQALPSAWPGCHAEKITKAQATLFILGHPAPADGRIDWHNRLEAAIRSNSATPRTTP
jgi:hypothetical protein